MNLNWQKALAKLSKHHVLIDCPLASNQRRKAGSVSGHAK